MQVFVTGATGFLGKRVVARLTTEGHNVRVLVRRPEAYQASAEVETIVALRPAVQGRRRAGKNVAHAAPPRPAAGDPL